MTNNLNKQGRAFYPGMGKTRTGNLDATHIEALRLEEVHGSRTVQCFEDLDLSLGAKDRNNQCWALSCAAA